MGIVKALFPYNDLRNLIRQFISAGLLRARRLPPGLGSWASACSGLIKPDTNSGGYITAINEVFNKKTTSIFLDRI